MADRLLDRLCGEHDLPRERLLAHVLAGDVTVNGAVERDPSVLLPPEALVLITKSERYVSRGGAKLAHAIDRWELPVENLVFVDAGASTGGFTDCLLQRGASCVHTVDVGYNQINYSLRTDARVRVMERTNIMGVRALDPRPNAGVADLSFRSISGAASALLDLTSDRWAVVLVKPQFEWLNAPPDFSGVVPDDQLEGVLLGVLDSLRAEGVQLCDLLESPITGRKGNREFLLLIGERRAGREPRSLLEQLL